jgi:hypothetical protein
VEGESDPGGIPLGWGWGNLTERRYNLGFLAPQKQPTKVINAVLGMKVKLPTLTGLTKIVLSKGEEGCPKASDTSASGVTVKS